MSESPVLDARTILAFRVSLLTWFEHNKRDLPWRTEPRDPYHVWLAETMLQQTQVATVVPYYLRWLGRFPTLDKLALASQNEVLKMWEGLGYYSRARNFHAAAQQVVEEYGSEIPRTVPELLKLPGIGPYTAGAIASLAFGADEPVLDGNVARVLSRVVALKEPITTNDAKKHLWDLCRKLLPPKHAGTFNEGLMDLGATICIERYPQCKVCPLNHLCNAYAKDAVETYPIRIPKVKIPHRDIATAVVQDASGKVLFTQRPAHGLLGGLWEFPGGEVTFDNSLKSEIQYDAPAIQLTAIIRDVTGLVVSIGAKDFIGRVKHTFTHFRITRHIAIVTLSQDEPTIAISQAYTHAKWVAISDSDSLALTRSDHKIIDLINSD